MGLLHGLRLLGSSSTHDAKLNAFGVGHYADKPLIVGVLVKSPSPEPLDERDGLLNIVDPQIEMHARLTELRFGHRLYVQHRSAPYRGTELEPTGQGLRSRWQIKNCAPKVSGTARIAVIEGHLGPCDRRPVHVGTDCTLRSDHATDLDAPRRLGRPDRRVGTCRFRSLHRES